MDATLWELWRGKDGAFSRRAGGPTSRGICSQWAMSVKSMRCRPICAIPISVRRVVEAADVVVNLVGIRAEGRRQTYEDIHVDGAATVARAAREAGAKGLVHISALGAEHSRGEYARTKAAGEEAVLGHFPGAVILRPALLFGAEDQLFNRFAAMARLSPVLPLIGGGRTRSQPVYVGDVATAIAMACACKARSATTYELGGPRIVTLRDLFDMTIGWTGRRRWCVPIPFWLAKLAAALTAPLPNSIRPMTMDEVHLLKWPNIVSDAAIDEKCTLAGLGIEHPNEMSSVVPTYLERFHRRGQFARYRRLGPPR